MNRFRARDFVNLSVLWFAIASQWTVLGPLVFPQIILRFVPEQLKGTYLGILMGSGLFVAMVCQPVMGTLSDHFHHRWGRRRPFMVVGIALDVCILAALYFVPSYLFFFLTVIALQVADNVAQGPYQALIPDLVPEGQRGVGSGFMGAMSVAGEITGSLMAALLAAKGHAVVAVFFVAVMLLVTMLWTVMTTREPRYHGPQIPLRQVARSARRAYSIQFRRYPDFLWLLLSRLFVLLAVRSLTNFAQYFLRDVIGVTNPPRSTGILLAVVAVGALAAILPGGWLSDHIGRKRLIYVSILVMAIGIALLLTARSFVQVVAYASIVGTAFGFFLSVDWALAADLVPKNESAKYMGFTNFATAGSGTLAWLIGGPLSDSFNARQAGLGYLVLFALALLYLLVATLALRPVREVKVRAEPAGGMQVGSQG